jgi:molecular chaperone HscC
VIVGIDLGTTNSLIGRMTASGPELIPNAHGSLLTPSVVGIDHDGHLLVGAAARELQVTHPDRCASVFKRLMGTDTTVRLVKRDYRPEELSALVLKSLRADAEAALQTLVTDAVITVPAYFNDMQRKATVSAGELAGLKVRRIINEPTAAAIAYGLHEATTERVAVVFDLGGGTFDVSVLDQFEGVLEIRSSAGEIFLGGEDFTRLIAGRILARRGITFEQAEVRMPRLVSRLNLECELAKRTLSREPAAEVRLPRDDGTVDDASERITITNEEFTDWASSLLQRTYLPLTRALNDAGVNARDVHDVMLVGGACRMPQIGTLIRNWFDREPRMSLNPDHVVALGAAVQAGLISRDQAVSDVMVTDVAPFSLGIDISHEIAGRFRSGYYLPILNRNTTIPASRVKDVYPLDSQQTSLTLHIFQGEARRTADNLKLGELEIHGIPVNASDRSVSVRLTYDLNGILEVEAVVNATGEKASCVITKNAATLSDQQLKAALQQMSLLKFHPRDQEQNRYLLLASERLYRELSGVTRDMLSRLMVEFDSALESQEPSLIESSRLLLESFLQQHDPHRWREDGEEDRPL